MRRVVRLIEFRKARRSGKTEGSFPGLVDLSSGLLGLCVLHLAGFVMTRAGSVPYFAQHETLSVTCAHCVLPTASIDSLPNLEPRGSLRR